MSQSPGASPVKLVFDWRTKTMKRTFERTTIVHDNVHRSGYKLVCSQCFAEESIVAAGYTKTLQLEAIGAKFRSKGWEVANRASKDLCPRCATPESIPKPPVKHHQHKGKPKMVEPKSPPQLKIVDGANPLGAAILKSVEGTVDKPNIPPYQDNGPRQMELDDRRIIFGKINEVYLDKDHGYSNNHTDVGIAKDLGVPVAWVKQIREENFGPEASNENLKNMETELTKINKAHQELHDLIQTEKLANVESRAKIAALEVAMKSLKDTINRFEKEIGIVKKQYGTR